MVGGLSLIWGSSFLFIANGLESFDPFTVGFLRLVLGASTLLAIPAARAVKIDRADWPRVLLLGVVWMAIPLTLFPVAEQWVSSALAGMLNGAMPLLVAAIAAVLLRRRPGRVVTFGLLIGFAGVLLIAAPSLGEGGSEVRGVVLILLALCCYGISSNVQMPLTQRYGSLGVQLRVQTVGAALTAPIGLIQLRHAEPHAVAVLSLLALGVLGTGLAFVVAGRLFAQVGATRGAIVTYLMPIVAVILGAVLRDDEVHLVAVGGMVLVLVGAIVVGRANGAGQTPRSSVNDAASADSVSPEATITPPSITA